MNPPYATATEFSDEYGKNKTGVSDTKINSLMKQNKIGRCSEQIYAQFIYRMIIMGISDISLFSPALLFSGESFKYLRHVLFKKYEFRTGFIMDSANFADVKSWGLTFSVLSNKN
jgi:hypothetical protein